MKALYVCAAALFVAGCGGGTPMSPPLAIPGTVTSQSAHHTVGLGKVLNSKGGQIFGFDIDRDGNDGALATASNVETFDQDTGAIIKSFPKSPPSGTTYGFNAIVTGDLGLVTRYVEPTGSIFAKRFYNLMSPTKGKFTGKWTPPVKDIQVEALGPNQTTGMTAIFAIELQNQDIPDLFESNIAKNKFGKVFHLNTSEFSLGDTPQVAQDTSTNQAVLATSPDGGEVGGAAPINVVVDLKTGKQKQWNGFNNGYFHAGFVNGIAIDSATGIFATDTELNAQVEFYNVANETGTFVQLPCSGNTSQILSGSGIANDPINGLFLVTEQFYGCNTGESAIIVYDESGNLVETITGFKFAIGEPAPVINPSKRMGWTFGPGFSQLQQFFY